MDAGGDFAKTAILLESSQTVFPACLGYGNKPMSHRQPAQLFTHILEAQTTLQDQALYDIVLGSGIAQPASRYGGCQAAHCTVGSMHPMAFVNSHVHQCSARHMTLIMRVK